MLTPNVHEITPQAIAAGLIATGQRPAEQIVTAPWNHFQEPVKVSTNVRGSTS